MISFRFSWKNLPKMLHARYDSGATMLPDGSIVVVGGDEKTCTTRSTERLTPDGAMPGQFKNWRPLTDLNTPHQSPGVAVYAGLIVVAGGFNNSAVEVMSIPEGDEVGQWTTICQTQYAEWFYPEFKQSRGFRAFSRSLAGAAVFVSKLSIIPLVLMQVGARGYLVVFSSSRAFPIAL